MTGTFPQPGGWSNQNPRRKGSRSTKIVLAVVGAFVAVCAIGGIAAALSDGGDDPAETADAGAAADRSQPAGGATTKPGKAAEKKQAGIGTPVRDGKLEFTVAKVQCGVTRVGNDFLNAKAQGQFCLINVKVKNIGKEARTLSDFNQQAYDVKGSKYEADTEAGIYANESNEAFLTDINPGNQVTAVIVFDVPKGTKLTKLELHDSTFSGGVNVAL